MKMVNFVQVKVSVLITTYNHEVFIVQAIESALMQKTDFDYEIVIGEDCSTDRTREIVIEYARRYPQQIRLLLHERNLGGFGVLNFTETLKACRGQYIAILEGDDYWTDPLKLQKQVDFLDQNPGCVMCHHDAINVDERGVIITKAELQFPDSIKKDFSGDELIKGAWIVTLTACFRNVIGEFPSEYFKVLNGDAFLFSMLGNHGYSKYVIEISAGAYRRHVGSSWSTLSTRRIYTYTINTFYWLSRYYGRLGQKEYSRHWFARYRNLLLQQLQDVSDIRNSLNVCREFVVRRENLVDIRFAYYLVSKLIGVLVRIARP